MIQKNIEKSIIIPSLHWIIGKSSYLSLYNIIRRIKWAHHELIPFWFAEVYILVWFGLILAGLIWLEKSNCLFNILVILSIYRLWDMLHGLGRIIFVEREHRHDKIGHYILARHVGRWAILTIINVFEIILCFSVLFLFWGSGFKEQITDPLTAFYQSILTITTLGYGEIHANNDASKILVISQLFYFLMYFLLILPMVFSSIRTKEYTKEILGQTGISDK